MVCYGITEHHGGTCRVLRPLEGDSEGDGEGEEVGEVSVHDLAVFE